MLGDQETDSIILSCQIKFLLCLLLVNPKVWKKLEITFEEGGNTDNYIAIPDPEYFWDLAHCLEKTHAKFGRNKQTHADLYLYRFLGLAIINLNISLIPFFSFRRFKHWRFRRFYVGHFTQFSFEHFSLSILLFWTFFFQNFCFRRTLLLRTFCTLDILTWNVLRHFRLKHIHFLSFDFSLWTNIGLVIWWGNCESSLLWLLWSQCFSIQIVRINVFI